MKIYYVSYIHDANYDTVIADTVFYLNEDHAATEASRLNTEELVSQEKNEADRKAKWEAKMFAWETLQYVKHEWDFTILFPYTHEKFEPAAPFKDKYEVRSITVEE